MIELRLLSDPTVSYASHQNHVPVIRELTLTNAGDADLHLVEVCISAEPAFAEPYTLRLEQLVAGEVRTVDVIKLALSHTFLANLSETVRGCLRVEALVDNAPVGSCKEAIDVLAYDQWSGTRSCAELLAAFCMPNAPEIDSLLHGAAELLAAADTALNGYQSKNRQIVWSQLAAIWAVLGDANILYSMPPASFDSNGQKIRTADRILSGKLATCLDLVMLLASCMEQAGLNPVILLKRGHAWLGCWLINTLLPTALVDDAQAIRKYIDCGEMLALETTLLTQRPALGLAMAAKSGRELLESTEDFTFALDIKRARMEQVLPLPARNQAATPQPLAPSATPAALEPPPNLPPLTGQSVTLDEDATDPTPAGRLARWKAKLVDLTLRNRMLNCRQTKTLLAVKVPDLGLMEDALARGDGWQFRPLPALMSGQRTSLDSQYRFAPEAIGSLALEAMRRGELQTLVDATMLQTQLREIYNVSRLAMQEGGANTLFLAMGFLEWVDDPRAEKSYRAPLLLIPVSLTRKSVREGYVMRRQDEETIVNPTLLELLRQQFAMEVGALQSLPGDDSGVDVRRVLSIVRDLVKPLSRWEVHEDAALGIFSFTKFLMWKDLQDRPDALRQNNVVGHLIDGTTGQFGDAQTLGRRDDLDLRHAPDTLLTPLLADSSQLNAVSRVAEGYDLVLEGPPGTGKSQTIANLICHGLGLGKRILFVSEKMAALEVVQRRLEKLGLGPACLEVHSSKARKIQVLEQFQQAMKAQTAHSVQHWQTRAARLNELRQQLNALAHALHQMHGNGLTVRQAIDTAIGLADAPTANLPWQNAEQHDAAQLEALRQLVGDAGQSLLGLHPLHHHPLEAMRQSQWSFQWEDQMREALEALGEAAKVLAAQWAGVCQMMALPPKPVAAVLETFAQAALLLREAQTKPRGLVQSLGDAAVITKLPRLHEHGSLRAQQWLALEKSFLPELASLNGQELLRQWQKTENAFGLLKWWRRRGLRRQVRPYTRGNVLPATHAMPSILQAVGVLNQHDAELAAMGDAAQQWFAEGYDQTATDWNKIHDANDWMQKLHVALARLAEKCSAGNPRQQVEDWLKHWATTCASIDQYTMLRDWLAAWNNLVEKRRRVGELADHTEMLQGDGQAPQGSGREDEMARLMQLSAQWLGARRQWRTWCRWQSCRRGLRDAQLDTVIAQIEQGDMPPDQLPRWFEQSYQLWWLKKIIDSQPVLRDFSAARHDALIQEFRHADEAFQELTQRYVCAELAARAAGALADPKLKLQVQLLQREMAKQRAHLPVRRLLAQLPDLLGQLKPCLLMSPLSVSQYLDAQQSHFDWVIFDEASQIPVWDAVGAIARGHQVLVVGDPKQLPPTRFFNSADEQEEFADDSGLPGSLTDLESILDECMAAGLPKLSLQWHYRSRHESLIAFSNARYYDHRLMTFPSPFSHDDAVRCEPVQGIYQRGTTKTNPMEAGRVIDLIESHAADPNRRTLSLGVVTFNQPQQQLIEEMLEERMRRQPELEQWVSSDAAEPLFIKNLENVQGDERDIILFSTTFAADQNGKMTMNFGPLNQQGGERRLNVAITRARQGVVVVSSLTADQIDLSRTRAQGVADLRAYLDFAQRGPGVLSSAAQAPGEQSRQAFERDVLRVLNQHGFTAHSAVGCGEYRIDMAVLHPQDPQRYILGIECDGAAYERLPTARDRDRLRQEILTRLGWKLHRLWAAEWWADKEAQAAILCQVLSAALGADEPRPPVAAPSA